MADCDHDCSNCAANCSERQPVDFSAKLNEYSSVKKVIAVVSGKGGVGKSMVTSMLACASQRGGLKTAVLDADITGPSIPRTFGIEGQTYAVKEGIVPATSASGIDIMSMNIMLDNDTDPVVWRGPIIAGVVKQFWTDVYWQDQDVMYVDMPPGTGDVTLTVFQSLPVDGIVIVSTPQQLVGMIVEKAVKMAGLMKIPVLALVENMSYVRCPGCGEVIKPFGESHLAELAAKYNIGLTASLPIDPVIAAAADEGAIEAVSGAWLDEIADAIAKLPEHKTQK